MVMLFWTWAKLAAAALAFSTRNTHSRARKHQRFRPTSVAMSLTLFIDPSDLDWIPLLFLLAVYGYILYTASNMISDGSELLLLIKSVAGIVGSVVLPVLGAVPDGAIVLFSGLGSDAQKQLSVGVGALAGSTIMLLTVPWLLSLFAGRVDCDKRTGEPVYKKQPPRLLKGGLQSGVLARPTVSTSAMIMLLTSLSFVVIQVPAFVEQCGSASVDSELKCVTHKNVTKWFALIGLIMSAAFFVWNLWKQVGSVLGLCLAFICLVSFCCVIWLCVGVWLWVCFKLTPTWFPPSLFMQMKDSKVGDAKRMEQIQKVLINKDLSVNTLFAHLIEKSLRSSDSLLGRRQDEKELKAILGHMFDMHDVSPKDGQLDKAELRELVHELQGQQMFADKDFDAWYNQLDDDNDGMVSRAEFVSAMRAYIKRGWRRPNVSGDALAAAQRVSAAAATADVGCELTNAADADGGEGKAADMEAGGAVSSHSSHDEDDSDESDVEEAPEDLRDLPEAEKLRRIKIRAATYMLTGTALVLVFSDPMVDVLSALGNKMGVKPFYVSFVLAPLASNASELLASFNYASKKTSKSITISFSALLGAAIMNNTFCLAIFLALVFFKGLVWEFAAETIAIVLVELVMFVIARRRVHRLYHGFLVIALYPISLVVVVVLENVVGLN